MVMFLPCKINSLGQGRTRISQRRLRVCGELRKPESEGSDGKCTKNEITHNCHDHHQVLEAAVAILKIACTAQWAELSVLSLETLLQCRER